MTELVNLTRFGCLMFYSPLSMSDQIMALGPKWQRPGGHMFYIGLYRDNIRIFLS